MNMFAVLKKMWTVEGKTKTVEDVNEGMAEDDTTDNCLTAKTPDSRPLLDSKYPDLGTKCSTRIRHIMSKFESHNNQKTAHQGNFRNRHIMPVNEEVNEQTVHVAVDEQSGQPGNVQCLECECNNVRGQECDPIPVQFGRQVCQEECLHVQDAETEMRC